MKPFFLLFIIIFIIACSGNRLPKNIIAINDMKTIIWDLTRAGQYREIKDITDTLSRKTSVTAAFQQVFSLHKIKKDDFYNSLHYYQSNPVLNKILFDSLAAFCNRQRELLYKRKPTKAEFNKVLLNYKSYPSLNKILFDSNSVRSLLHADTLYKRKKVVAAAADSLQ